MDDVLNQNYQNLAHAVVWRAAEDYKGILKRLKRNPSNKIALAEKEEIEEFFKSSWCNTLSNIDGNIIIERMKEKILGEDYRKADKYINWIIEELDE